MGTMGSKLRKGRAAYAKSVARAHQALATQKGYVSDYNKLLNMGPNPPTKRALMSAGRGRRPDAWAEGFKFVGKEDYRTRSKYRGRHAMNQWHFTTHYRPVSSYGGLLEEFKQKAIQAELTGIPEAETAIAGIRPMDLSYIRSPAKRKGTRGGASKKGTITGWDPKKQEYIKTGGTDNFLSEATKKAQQELSDSYGISTFNLYGGLSTSPTKGSAGARINEKGGANVKVERKHTAEEIASGANPDFKIFDTVYREKVDQTEQLKNAEYADRNQQSIQNTGLSLAVREEQQKLSDDFGILTFDVKGNLSTLPKSGMVDWDALGLSGDEHKERRGKVKEQFGQEIMSSMIPSQMKTQAKKETELEAELKSVNKKMKIYDKWNRQTDSMEHDNSDEYWELAIRKKEITSSLQNINNDQKVIAAALESVDYNTMMHYLAKNDVITEDSRKQYVQFGDPSKASLKQELTAAGYEWEQQRESTSELASAITRLEGLDKNNMGTVRQQESLDKEITRLENYFQIDLDEKGGVDKVVSQLSEQLTLSQKEQHNLKQNKDKLAHQYSSTLTNKERTAAAAGQNRNRSGKE